MKEGNMVDAKQTVNDIYCFSTKLGHVAGRYVTDFAIFILFSLILFIYLLNSDGNQVSTV